MNVNALGIKYSESTNDWADLISDQLDLVEMRLRETTVSDVVTATDLSEHLLDAGGKRIRPALVILSALACGLSIDDQRMIDLATAVELVHTASLVHDDVVDETKERRGVTTANCTWGNKISVLCGDFLLSKSFSLLGSLSNLQIIQSLSYTSIQMTEAEILQATSEGTLELWELNYRQIINGKTASFMGACCECGAILAGASDEVKSALKDYGTKIGLAFQISDDLLDILGDPQKTGKEIGTDLTHGKFTLPILIALRNYNADARKQLFINEGLITSEEARKLAQLALECGATEEARQIAKSYSEKAREHLEMLSPSEYALALGNLAASVVDRDV